MKHLLMLALFASTWIPAFASSPRPLRVVATTTIVGDVVRAIGEPHLDLTVLLGAGMDPHTFEPAPRDAATVADTQVLFLNGGGLETFLAPLLEANRNRDTLVVDLCEGLPLVHRETACTEHDHEEHAHHEDGELDPHVWLDPRLVAAWADTIGRVLGERDPERAAHYQERAAAYRRQLAELDDWIREQVDTLPAPQRRFITDHHEFGYFADRYGFTITGALLPNLTTAAETSAREMAALETEIQRTGTRVLVVGVGANPSLARRVARDHGLRVVQLYTGALSESGGPAPTYLELMRFNVRALVEALTGKAP
jgi:ABC-type Zn uptake system ZnuABC Zn-binding protein ZnuA